LSAAELGARNLKFGFIDDGQSGGGGMRHEERRYAHTDVAPVYAHPGTISSKHAGGGGSSSSGGAANNTAGASRAPSQPATQQSQQSSQSQLSSSQQSSVSYSAAHSGHLTPAQLSQKHAAALAMAAGRAPPRNVYASAAAAYEANPVAPPRVHAVASYSGDRAAAIEQAKQQEQQAAARQRKQSQQQPQQQPPQQAQHASQSSYAAPSYQSQQLGLDSADLSLSQLSLADLGATQDLSFHSQQSQMHFR